MNNTGKDSLRTSNLEHQTSNFSYIYPMLYLLLFLFLHHQQSQYTTVLTTANKITFHYRHGGQGLDAPARSDKSIVFTMNGQMYKADSYAPVGLYVQQGKQFSKKIVLNNSATNYGIAPQMVFYVTKEGKAGMTTASAATPTSYQWAVEISPQLVHGGQLSPRIKGMHRELPRNAIGVKKDGTVALVCSNGEVGMQELAEYMKSIGCTEAAFVDGGVSEYWKPGTTTYGTFGVVVAVHK